MRCDVSTFPPQTAAVRDGANRLPLGVRTITQTQRKSRCRNERITVKGDQTTRIQRNVNIQHGTYAIYYGGVDDRNRRVEVSTNLASCALEVEYSGAIVLVYLDSKTDLQFPAMSQNVSCNALDRVTCRGTIIQIINRIQDVRAQFLGNATQKVAHRALCIISDMMHVFLNSFQAIILHD
jgi:hypothetical protein